MAGNLSTWSNQPGSSSCAENISCVLKTTAVSLISVLTVVGNLITLVTVGSTKLLRNCHGCLLISLSLADFVTGLVASTSIYPSIYTTWPYGDVVCLLTAAVEATTKKIAPLTMTAMSIERYIAVVHPLRYSRIVTKKLVFLGILICWTAPITFFTPLILKGQIAYKFAFRLSSCTATYIDQVVSVLLNTVIFILPSMITVCVTSSLVWREFKRNARMRSLLTMKYGNRASRTKRAVKFFRMTRIMTFTFYFCWAPHVIVGFISIITKKRLPLDVYFALYWLHFSNSFWNVVIYVVMNDAYRRRILVLARSPITAVFHVFQRTAKSKRDSRSEIADSGVATIKTDMSSTSGPKTIRIPDISYKKVS